MIDGHVDLPIAVREWYGNNINKINLNKQVRRNTTSTSYTDTKCLRKGASVEVCSLYSLLISISNVREKVD